MTDDQLRQLANRLEPMAAAPVFDGLDVPAFVAWLRQCAGQQPVAWMSPKHAIAYGIDYGDDTTFPVAMKKHDLFCVPLYAAPLPPTEAQREPNPDEVICPACTHQFRAIPENVQALLAQREPTEARTKARDALLDFISENGTTSEGVQYYLDRYVRAALAAKDK